MDLHIVESKLFEPKLKGMLVPFGLYKNAWLVDVPIGAIMSTIDNPPKQVRLMSKTVISIKSPIAETLSMMLYGRSMSFIFSKMLQNWKSDIDRENIFFITVKEIEYE